MSYMQMLPSVLAKVLSHICNLATRLVLEMIKDKLRDQPLHHSLTQSCTQSLRHSCTEYFIFLTAKCLVFSFDQCQPALRIMMIVTWQQVEMSVKRI